MDRPRDGAYICILARALSARVARPYEPSRCKPAPAFAFTGARVPVTSAPCVTWKP